MRQKQQQGKGRYFVRTYSGLVTTLHQICRTETGLPVNPLVFYVHKAEAEAVIKEAEGKFASEGG